jgi:hypothetical protein
MVSLSVGAIRPMRVSSSDSPRSLEFRVDGRQSRSNHIVEKPPRHSATARKHEGEKEDDKKEQKGSCFGAGRLTANTAQVGGYALTVRLVKIERARASFLRHADLSPDGHSGWRNTKGNLASQIPLRTHRWDESDRVFLAGCSPAEPVSASSIHSAYQSFYVRAVGDPPAGPCVVGDCAREFQLPIHLPSVSRSAGLLLLNLRGRRLGVVPANGCLATLPLRWSCQVIVDSSEL